MAEIKVLYHDLPTLVKEFSKDIPRQPQLPPGLERDGECGGDGGQGGGGGGAGGVGGGGGGVDKAAAEGIYILEEDMARSLVQSHRWP